MSNKEKVIKKDIDYLHQELSSELDLIQGSRVLLTGGAGFLGYNFINLFESIGKIDHRKPIKLTIIDNFKRGKKDWLEKFKNNLNITLLDDDISKVDHSSLSDFDYIIHAASIASPTFYRMFPIETIDSNVQGLRNLLDYAKENEDHKKPIKGMLFFSTSEIYGDPDEKFIPTPENYKGNVSCTGPRACYDESKRLGETLCVNFSQVYNLPIKIVRPFNNYGPGLDINDKRIIPDIAKSIIKNENIELLSDGKATRTFCYVSDAISGYIKVLVNGKAGHSYNVGNDKPEINMHDLAKKFQFVGNNLFNYSKKVTFKVSNDKEYLTDNPQRRCPNIDKISTELNFSPKISLETGIENSLKWYS